MKRIVAAVFGLLLLAMPVAVRGQFGYSVNSWDTNTATITNYTGAGGDIVIPTNIDGLVVTEIGTNAFAVIPSLISVTIPGSVTNIGDAAFELCLNLAGLYFSGNAPTVGSNVFEFDNNPIAYYEPGASGWDSTFDGLTNSLWYLGYGLLTNSNRTLTITGYSGTNDALVIPASVNGAAVTAIGSQAFSRNSAVVSVVIPGSVKSLGEAAFANCPNLSSVTFGSGVTNISDSSFIQCYNLTNVTIPGNVTSIGASAFYRCDNLAGLALAKGLISIGAEAFFGCSGLSSVTIPDGVTNVGELAFSGSGLVRVIIPASLTSPGQWAFESCSALVSAFFKGNAPAVDLDAFVNDNNATIYYLPGASGWAAVFDGLPTALWEQDYGYEANSNDTNTVSITGYAGNGGDVTLPAEIDGLQVTGIGPAAFESVNNLTNVTVPRSVTTISAMAFQSCLNLAAVYFYGAAPAVDAGAFDADTNTTIYYFPGTAGWNSTFAGLPTMPIQTWSVQVNIAPGAAVTAGGQWQLDGGVLLDSGATVTNLPVTNHTAFVPALSGYAFAGWTTNGVAAGSSTNYTFALNTNIILVANFLMTPPSSQIGIFNGTNAMRNGQTNAVDFGTVLANTTGPVVTFTVTNAGVQALNLEGVTVPAGFTLASSFPSTIAPGGSGAFNVQVDLTMPGTNSGNVTVTSDDTSYSPFSFPVTGFVATKIISLSGNLAFGGVAFPADIVPAASNTLTIINLGNTTLTVTSLSFPDGFTYSSWPGGPIPPGGSESETVGFTPTGAAAYGGVATVYSDATSGVGTIPISGYGADGSLTLTIVVNGNGTVSPDLNGESLKNGARYTLKAAAGKGAVFTGWSGSVSSSKNPLTFTMAPSTVLQANFINNPFLPAKGTYNGLFAAPHGVTEQTAGMIKNLSVGQNGNFSGTLLLNGQSHALSGAFDFSLQATNHISRTASQGGPLTAEMTLSVSTNFAPQVTGTVSAATWTANLLADIASNTMPSAEYTMLIPPDTNNAPPVSSPGGDGYALITNHLGTAKITGALADGTALSQSVPVSPDGYIPIYTSLYSGKGLLLGWINLESINADRASLTWIHPQTRSGLYAGGFTNFLSTNQILLSPWTNPGNFDLLTNLAILDTIYDTNVETNLLVAVSGSGKVTGATEHVTGSINPKTGLLTVTIGSGAARITGHGVILSSAAGTNGGGYFLNKTNAQAIKLEP